MQVILRTAMAVIALAITPAAAEISAADMITHLDSKDATLRASAVIALDYLASGIRWSNAHTHVHWGRDIYCAPDNISLQNDQLKDMMKRVIETKPYLAQMYVGSVLLEALQFTFPCKAQN